MGQKLHFLRQLQSVTLLAVERKCTQLLDADAVVLPMRLRQAIKTDV